MRERNFFFAASNVSLTTPEPVSRPSAIAAGSTRSTVHGLQADVPPRPDGPTPAPARNTHVPAADRPARRLAVTPKCSAGRHQEPERDPHLVPTSLSPQRLVSFAKDGVWTSVTERAHSSRIGGRNQDASTARRTSRPRLRRA